jgi:UBX domain-containing protein 1
VAQVLGVFYFFFIMSTPNDQEDEDGQKYYAGGEKSGQFVQGPPKNKSASQAEANKLVEDILAMAAKGGAAPSGSEDRPADAPRNVFAGRGNRLGDENAPAATTEAPVIGQPEAVAPLVERRLVFYRNGFVIDNRPDVLHDYNGIPYFNDV